MHGAIAHRRSGVSSARASSRLPCNALSARGFHALFCDDIHHRALIVRQPVFLALTSTILLRCNAIFALIYAVGARSTANQFLRGFGGALFFSVWKSG